LAVNQPASANSDFRTPHATIITSGNDWSGFPSISADGRWITFASNADNLVEGDTNQTADIFVFDRLTERFERVSVSSEGLEANAISTRPAISADGRFVAFESLADNLVYGDTNFLSDIFVHDRLTGLTAWVSVDANGFEGNGWSEQASISGDGHYVAFISAADNLLPNDTNGVRDAFLHNRLSGYTQRASISSNGEQANGETSTAIVTPSSRTVMFLSQAGNLTGSNNPSSSIFAHNRLLPRTAQIPGTGEAVGLDTSTGGQWIAYRLPDDAQTAKNVYIYDQLNESTYTARFPATLTQHALGNNGGHIAAVGTPNNGRTFDLYWHNIESGETLIPVEGVSDVRPAISANGNVIAYVQEENGIPQIYIFNRGVQPEPTYYISGRVTSPLGDPLALVTITDNNGNSVETDGLGYFFLSGITPGQVSLSLSKEGFDFEPRGASFIVTSDLTEKNFIYRYTKVIEEARKDIGMPYDHRCDSGPGCEGIFHGYSKGQCTDLVLDAFTWGGDYNIKLALEQDALAHPEHFYQNTNARDAFDMWRYYMYSGLMLSHEQPYLPGDMVFFDWSGDGEIDHVALVSQVDGNNRPTWMVDATGVIASNPNGLAAEMPWEPFHDRSERGHARWNGAYESPVLEPPQGQFLQIGLGSVGADLHLISEQGNGLGGTDSSLPGGVFFDLIWEQNLAVADPLAEGVDPANGARYYVVISNPTEEQMPYYFVVQTVQDSGVDEVVKFTGQLDPGRVRFMPLVLSMQDDLLRFELISFTRQSSGSLKP
jgi:Tol biopolymer transport system component